MRWRRGRWQGTGRVRIQILNDVLKGHLWPAERTAHMTVQQAKQPPSFFLAALLDFSGSGVSVTG